MSKAEKLTTWGRFSVFIVNFEQISQIVLVFLLLTLNKEPLDYNKLYCTSRKKYKVPS